MEEIAIAVVFGITGWMLKTWLTHQERMKALSVDKQRIGSAEERLARVEHAVESIAIEVERISEGQRYVTTMLHERVPLAIGEGPTAS
ncbi:MAG: hypothetical protein H0X64_10265 [Gemmatimonadaceae bacterium]|nr:hypothetical protein [Gemmatimonadaceae bacterium]